ncbi:hypothetical protein KIN20_028302 [Parelaphostrongylus tenuis]|uniref:PiggyBac transposable element-derived protein domain-containing protein n=1 Tax=Parelaphostrongylus tenuis TaxID=148309 RepID=A0AAD5WEK8_PARTN|nr:hypothetical protein KIN20_028302 [Parelaphostrongylus tenuis]
MEDLLDQTRHPYVNSWYTSVVKEHIPYRDKQKNWRGMSMEVMQGRVRKTKWRAMQYQRGAMVFKWMDKRYVRMILTSHGSAVNATHKFQAIESYNKMKRMVMAVILCPLVIGAISAYDVDGYRTRRGTKRKLPNTSEC